MTVETFGERLKIILDERNMSLRQCSKETGIDKATISRIINGKRQANVHHLNKLSSCLEIPFDELMSIAGYSTHSVRPPELSSMSQSMEDIQEVLKAEDFYDGEFSEDAVREKLSQYEQYAQTKEGKETIHHEFHKKLDKVGSIGPFIDHLKQFYIQFEQQKGTHYKLAVLGSVLLYFIIPVDVVPDYIFPIGYIDDAFAVKVALKLFSV